MLSTANGMEKILSSVGSACRTRVVSPPAAASHGDERIPRISQSVDYLRQDAQRLGVVFMHEDDIAWHYTVRMRTCQHGLGLSERVPAVDRPHSDGAPMERCPYWQPARELAPWRPEAARAGGWLGIAKGLFATQDILTESAPASGGVHTVVVAVAADQVSAAARLPDQFRMCVRLLADVEERRWTVETRQYAQQCRCVTRARTVIERQSDGRGSGAHAVGEPGRRDDNRLDS